MNDISKRMAALSPEHRKLLEQVLRKKGFNVSQLPIIPYDRDAVSFPLSFAQQRLWFLNQLEPDNPYFNLSKAFHISGALDLVALKQSFNELIRRHETLRTIFPVNNGEPVQVIHSTATLTLAIVDLQNFTEKEQEEQLSQLLTESSQRPFDQIQGPLLRATLFQLKPQEYVLLVTMHHMISDGWSMDILIREMALLYEAFCTNQPLALPYLPIQYVDFAIWQREWLRGETLESQLSYWKQQLGPNLPLLQLPTDRSHQVNQPFRSASRWFVIPRSLTDALKQLSREEGSTLFMVLLTAFKILLYRYTNQQDIVVGSPIANRNRAEVEGLIGFFVNTLVLRSDLSGNPRFKALLSRIRQVTLAAYEHQDLPFEKLVEELKPERDLSRHPLYQVMFHLQNAPSSAVKLGDSMLKQLQIDRHGAALDLVINLWEKSEELSGVVDYNKQLFDGTTIDRLIGHFKTLLESIIRDPEQQISELQMLTEAERHQLLVEWNTIKVKSYPCVHQLFEAQARQNPDAIAVTFENKQLSYGDLNAKSNQLAYALEALGVQPNQTIAIFLDSGIQQIITLLAVLKAGCSFVCLDPNYPLSRLEQILEEVSPPCLISELIHQEHLQDLLGPLNKKFKYQVLMLDAPAYFSENFKHDNEFYTSFNFESLPTSNPTLKISSDAPIYIVYTSGSTGKPKGIVQSHSSFCQFLEWFSHQFYIQFPKRIAQWASITYDASYCEIFGALCFGATLCLTTAAVRYDPRSLLEWVETENISLLQVVPSFCRQLIRVLELSNINRSHLFANLEFMLLAGEELGIDLARDWLDMFPHVEFFNLYGPTEAVLATYHAVENVRRDQHSISVGKAIDGRQILILDQDQQLCPVGVEGEIYIRSPYLTLGYFKRPEETQRAFVQNPLHNEYPDRVYQTGDAGKWLPNGNIEFHGRIDYQVKIRGMRVELKEIETALFSSGSISECAVKVHDYGDYDQRLVAYIVPKAGQPFTVSNLRDFLREKLPEHMVPSLWMSLESLPRTPNGKLDRRALPSPGQQYRMEETFVAPRNMLEFKMMRIWENILNTQSIGIRDSFFEVGGHSLIAVQLFAEIERVFNRKLPLATLFQAPTIEHLVSILESPEKFSTRDSLVQLRSGGTKQPLFLVHDADGEILLYFNLARHLDNERPVYGLQPYSKNGYPLLHMRLRDIVDHYIKEIRTVQPKGPYFIGGLCMGGFLAFEIAVQLQAQGQEVGLVALMDAADIHAPRQTGYVSRRRLTRFLQAVGYYQQLKGTEKFVYIVKVITEKLKNLIAYEIAQKIEVVRNKIWIKLYMYYLNKGLPLPHFLKNISIRTLFKVAKQDYVPRVYYGQVVLFRASEGEGSDEPLVKRLSDPLFGWGKRTKSKVEVCDIRGGHSSMLQEPYVQALAEKLQAYMNDSCVELTERE